LTGEPLAESAKSAKARRAEANDEGESLTAIAAKPKKEAQSQEAQVGEEDTPRRDGAEEEMTQTATRERWSRQEDEGRGERVCRLEVGGGVVGGKAWAVARVLITTSRSKERRPGVGHVALGGEAVR
jgi:hypothetical protein